jgi:uncharacterized membrane protein YbaN (DUF454 family)
MKLFLIILGMISVGLGAIGIVLPVLPTTPFLLLAAWLFLRSSDRFYNWLMNHKVFGKYVKDYIEKKGVRKGIKIWALALLWPSIIFSSFYIPLWIGRVTLYIIATLVTIHILKLKTL